MDILQDIHVIIFSCESTAGSPQQKLLRRGGHQLLILTDGYPALGVFLLTNVNQMAWIKGEYFIVPNKSFIKGKKPEYRSVYLSLCDHADNDGSCFPSRAKIAKDSGVSVKTVDRVLGLMIDDGVIKKENRINGGEKLSNRYQIMLVGGRVPQSLGRVPETLGSVPSDPLTISSELYPITTLSKDKGASHNSRKATREEREQVDMLIGGLKDGLRSQALDGTIQQNRNWAWLGLKKFGFEKMRLAIKLGTTDSYHQPKCVNMGYVYKNVLSIINNVPQAPVVKRYGQNKN